MRDVDQVRIVPFEELYRTRVIDLWKRCGLVRTWNDPDKDIDRKLSDRTGIFPLLVLEERVVGSVMASYDGHRGSVYYLGIDPEFRLHGLGHKLMAHCESYLTGLGCPKVDLFVRQGNEAVIRFYEQLGYTAETSVPLGKRLIADD
ncbi:MAG: GNAT family acetyltransferase [Roseibium sp.]